MLVVIGVVHSLVSARVEGEASESLRRDESAFVHWQATQSFASAPAPAMIENSQE